MALSYPQASWEERNKTNIIDENANFIQHLNDCSINNLRYKELDNFQCLHVIILNMQMIKLGNSLFIAMD